MNMIKNFIFDPRQGLPAQTHARLTSVTNLVPAQDSHLRGIRNCVGMNALRSSTSADGYRPDAERLTRYRRLSISNPR